MKPSNPNDTPKSAKITRYVQVVVGEMRPSDNGPWVKYDSIAHLLTSPPLEFDADNYIISQLLQCVEEAEGLIDGGEVTRKAEKHVAAWRKRKAKESQLTKGGSK